MLKLFMFCLAVVGLVVGQSLRESSCVDRCGIRFNHRLICQCNKKCPIYGNCCPDYSTKCELTNSKRCQTSGVTQNDLSSISLKLYDLDVNRASPDDYVINPQAMTTSWHLRDMSPNRFFTSVNQNLLNKPTYQALINLLDNYEMIQGKDEYVTKAETDEIYTFLNAFMSTSIGRKLYEFLSEKGLSGCENKITFIENLKKMWFDLYSRESHAMDTSGFEHVFVGEIKGSKVSGLHNWVQIYLQENSRRLNYYGYPGKAEPSFYYVRFEWNGYKKHRSGTFIGSSPEYDFAIFTLCHLTRSGSDCKVKLRNRINQIITRSVQTYAWINYSPTGDDGLKYVASAYFDF